ncbi:hypothetical protein HYC85_017659 [Camellia sinensis]|uniref:Uncharacterized protein n=1 Tax=Camellia sinensis TaxID=4442 RepID=A0A7J7GS16_CAMSI|nr:hypothetical protein HYC85_017659 [Camellia sinensis]
MDSPSMEKSGSQIPYTISPSTSRRTKRRSTDSNSPDFEFWMVRNPSFPPPNLLSADELFVDGVLLPLHLLHLHHDDPPEPDPSPNPEEPASETGTGPELAAAMDPSTAALTGSKRWRDIFKKTDRKSEDKEKEREKEKRKERKANTGGGGGGVTSAELNINLWPFSRSRSAGNSGVRPKMGGGSAVTRKVSSAPCSRSNSAGESKSRKWPSSPSRGGVHLGRSSPVWHVRRSGRSSDPAVVRNAAEKAVMETRRKKIPSATAANGNGGGDSGGGGSKARVLSLNVPMCIGYKQHLSCRSDESSAVSVTSSAAVGGGASGGQSGGSGSGGGGGRAGNLFNLRGLFSKKVY